MVFSVIDKRIAVKAMLHWKGLFSRQVDESIDGLLDIEAMSDTDRIDECSIAHGGCDRVVFDSAKS